MVKDHTQAANELKPIAMQLNVQQPTQVDQKHKDLADKLSKLQGNEFDREYINAMVTGHEEVAGTLRMRVEQKTAPNDAGEQKLTQWATMALPTVQKHLERAREIQKKVARSNASYRRPCSFLKDGQFAFSSRNSASFRHMRNGLVDFSSAIVDEGRAP